jgi:DNA gyrase/topoisomerase IV subunit A
MLIALGIIMLLGGGVTSLLTQQLKLDHKRAATVLEGTAVRKPALDLLDAMRKNSTQSLKTSQKMVNEAVKKGRDHDLTSSQLEPIVDPYLQKLAQLDRAFLEQRDSLRTKLTREQWDSVFQPDSTVGAGPDGE